jgi:hypothetical protein
MPTTYDEQQLDEETDEAHYNESDSCLSADF